ncbi:MAG: peptide ABC transporter substrate-binding protein, partial [Phyllobacterium sp.]|nr:peptide ABC transporter substrate-binding protein [Phyllobacterium sp.]
GKFNVARAGWTADYADAENFMVINLSTNTTFNYGRWNNPDFDALVKKSYDEKDPAARAKILHEAETLVLQEQPVAPMMNFGQLWLVSNRVKGWKDNGTNDHLSKYLSLEQ